MTKAELAKAVATNMKKINPDVDIMRMTIVLGNGMTKHELEKALKGYERN